MWGIILSIACCLIFFIGFAIWTSLGDVELVYDNYYDKDVVFEQQIRRVERTDALGEKPQLHYSNEREELKILFPISLRNPELKGDILLFRPSDLNQDRTFELNLIGDSLQILSVPGMTRGLWRLKLSWSSQGLEYYHEESLMVK